MFQDLIASSNIPSNINNFDVPTVVYNLEKSVHSRIFNFNKFVSKLNFGRFLQDKTIPPCYCEGSEFIDQHNKHILTDNLSTKGPKY